MFNLLFASEGNFNERVSFFKNLPPEETTDVKKNGDHLFEGYLTGNTIEKIDRPYERFHDYEKLLIELKSIDETKYNKLHKGTPFYFLAWLAFDFKSYDKGLYYIDEAIAEDIVHRPATWQDGTAIQFYYLKTDSPLSTRTVSKIRELFVSQMNRFVSDTGVSINLTDFIEKFVKPIINDPDKTKRSLISAIYVFLLEFEDLYQLLKIRTFHGGSTLLFIDYLFNGGIIFESLLKEFYPGTGTTLGPILNQNLLFKSDFPSPDFKTGAITLNEIVGIITNSSFITAFTVTSRLRNTTGHKVAWDDIFDDPENFRKLFEQEVNALFYLIAKKIS